MALTVLLVDDDARLVRMLEEYLSEHGFAVESRGDVEGGLERAQRGGLDALVLDLSLPDGDGLELCRRLRARSDVPIVMLTARGDDTDRIVGLELGADDYLPKPFNPRELLARLRAVLRRGRAGAAVGGVLRFGRLEIDREAREARRDGEPLALTSHQFELLRILAERAGRVVSRSELMEAARGEPLAAYDRSIDVHISRIRAAIEDDPSAPRHIKTVRGVGYAFVRTPEDPA